ncbi:hypothetical protein SAMN05421761_11691 [Belliella pelovolcani]|uniref:Uncharacterized protein n=1 Tax=Belliella pelovolcani TaxID=529505 RepID=A0A1N7PIL7_9BACT|nr:hypothetical protein SAMN05421761_11691 [Belliella pelovolcani]
MFIPVLEFILRDSISKNLIRLKRGRKAINCAIEQLARCRNVYDIPSFPSHLFQSHGMFYSELVSSQSLNHQL